MGIKSSMVAGSFLGSHPSNCLYRITPASYNHNWTDLHYAACQGNVHVLHRILFLEGIRDIDTKDYYGKSPLYWASYKGHLACMEDLIRFGADVDSVCCHGASPLHVAIGLYPDCSALLIKHGSNVDMADKWGVTPMYLAASNAQTHCIQLLLSAGAKPTYRNRKTGLVPRQLVKHQQFCDWLETVSHNPPSLKHQCRLVARRAVGPYPVAKLSRLALPKTLRDYLLFADFDGIIHEGCHLRTCSRVVVPETSHL